jgi:hypothetical protein
MKIVVFIELYVMLNVRNAAIRLRVLLLLFGTSDFRLADDKLLSRYPIIGSQENILIFNENVDSPVASITVSSIGFLCLELILIRHLITEHTKATTGM